MRRLVCCLALAAMLPVAAEASDWPTFHGDNTRQGDDTVDPGLANPTPLWTTPALDGAIYAQPVIVGGQVIVATENNTVYSLAAATGAVQWSTHLGTPRTTITCGNINPLGITGTPVVDAGTVFVTADIQLSSTSFEFDLDALDLSTGAVTFKHNIAPSDPQWSTVVPWEQQRGALLAVGGRVFVPLGGLAGDCGSYHGYVLSFPESGSGSVTWWASSEVDAGDNEAGIWAAGGLSADAAGDIYAGTGNSNHIQATDVYDYGDAVIKLNAAALSAGAPLDYFAPTTWYQDNANDQDLGSTTPLQLPNSRVFIVGKTGTGYLLNTASLGHIGGQLAAHQVCRGTGDDAFGTLAYDSGLVFVGCSDGLAAVQISGSGNDFSPAWYNSANVANHPPTVAGGLVWSVSSSGTEVLGFSLAGGQLMRALNISGSNHFTTPSAANDELLVAGGTQVNAFTGAPPAATRYHPLSPYRVLDTRRSSCVQCGSGAIGPGQARDVAVAGFTPPGFGGAIVPSSAGAVVVNATAVNATAGTYLTLSPTGEPPPVASTVNTGAGAIVANLATVLLGSGGDLSVYNAAGSIDVVLDIEGYYDGTAGTSGTFHALTPLRICDTRAGGGTVCASGTDNPLGAGATRLITVWGSSLSGAPGVPSDGTAAAAVLNLTAVSGTAATYLTAYPPSASTHTCGAPPVASNVNVPSATARPNRVTVPMDLNNGGVCVFNAQGTIDVIVDVDGWYGTGAEAAGAHFFAVPPIRLCDTRGGQGTACAGSTLDPGATLAVQTAGVDGLPASGVQAIEANGTAVNGSMATFLTLYPAGGTLPPTSDLNPAQGTIVANMSIVALSAGGSIDVFNAQGSIDVVLDVGGWFS